MQLFRNGNTRAAQSRYVQRLADAERRQNARSHKRIGAHIGCYFSVVDDDNAVYRTVQHVFNTVFDNDNRFAVFLMNVVDQFDCRLTGFRIKVCKRFVEQKHAHVVHHNAGKRNTLLLAARKFVRRRS